MKAHSRYVALLILTSVALGCAEGPRRESTGQYLDDSAVTAKVKTALLNEPAVSGLDINVETFRGTVQLSGFANTESERNIAVGVARKVSGVEGVVNDVRIKRK